MIGKPRGKKQTYPVYVYDPAAGRKRYVGSRRDLDSAQALEDEARAIFSPYIPAPKPSTGPPRRSRLKKGAPRWVEDEETGCWLWLGCQNGRGYGRWRIGRQMRPAHREVWEREVGPIPEGLELDHLCRVRHCVNPDHLEPVTHAENMRRGKQARQEANA